jgi:hypothetical protein
VILFGGGGVSREIMGTPMWALTTSSRFRPLAMGADGKCDEFDGAKRSCDLREDACRSAFNSLRKGRALFSRCSG